MFRSQPSPCRSDHNDWVSICYHSRSRSLLVVLRASCRILGVSASAYPASPSDVSLCCSLSLKSVSSSPRKSSLSSFPPLMNSVQPHPTRAMPPNTPQASNSPLCCKRIDSVNRPPDTKGPNDRPAAERVWAIPLSEPRVSCVGAEFVICNSEQKVIKTCYGVWHLRAIEHSSAHPRHSNS